MCSERKALSTYIKRELWASCGGYCQNPNCNEYLFFKSDDNTISLAETAHIIGLGNNSPRSEHELAKYIDKNGYDNLIMLCLKCHKIIDVLENEFSVETIKAWKTNHILKINTIFNTPIFSNRKDMFLEISHLLDENNAIFTTYGPFSKLATEGDSGDTYTIWRRRCIDTILPNNSRIINILERNKRLLPYPWEGYQAFTLFIIHANSFRENCIFDERVNDYKQFPYDFDYIVKSALEINISKPELREKEEIAARSKTINQYITKFLANHSFIANMKRWNNFIFEVELIDGRLLRIFTTNTYYFTEYTFEKVLSIDPNIDAIICSNPYAYYSSIAKEICIESNVGLFMLREFMGAIRYTGEKFLNYLVIKDKQDRISYFKNRLNYLKIDKNIFEIYLMGSFLRGQHYNDIDLIIVYKRKLAYENIYQIISAIKKECDIYKDELDFTICSELEFTQFIFIDDNKVQVL